MTFDPNEQENAPEPIDQTTSPDPSSPEAASQDTTESQSGKQSPVMIGVLIVVILALVFGIFWVLRGNDGGDNSGGATVLPTATVEVVVPTAVPGEPMATATNADGVNIRSGPGTNYDVIGILPNGASAPVIGRNADGQWWVLDIPAASNGQGWVSADLVVVENAGDVPVILPPAPPTAVPTGVPTETPAPAETPVVTILFSADSNLINEGECTTLRWKVDNVREVYVYPVGESWSDFPQAGEGSEEVCPTETTAYEMRVVLQDGTVDQRQLTVEVVPGNPLVETSWMLASMNVNQILLPDTTITLAFDDAKSLSGNASCNTYNGAYSITGDQLAIGPLTATRQTCGEEIDAQEQAYMTALQSAATFTLSGEQLIIYDASVNEILRFDALKAVQL